MSKIDLTIADGWSRTVEMMERQVEIEQMGKLAFVREKRFLKEAASNRIMKDFAPKDSGESG